MLKYREARYIAERLKGSEMGESLVKAGFPTWMKRNPGQHIENGEVKAKLEEMQAELIKATLNVGLTDAIELHEHLTDQLRGDLAELYTDAGELKPIKDWPMWARQGGVEVVDSPNMVPSKDGDSASWDQVGRKQVVKTLPRSKTIELLARLKPVDALVAQQKHDVNVVVVTAERAREVQAAFKRLDRLSNPASVEGEVIEVTPVDEDPKPT